MYYVPTTILGVSGMSKYIEIDIIIANIHIIINFDIGYGRKVQGTNLEGRYIMEGFRKIIS